MGCFAKSVCACASISLWPDTGSTTFNMFLLAFLLYEDHPTILKLYFIWSECEILIFACRKYRFQHVLEASSFPVI